MLTLNTKKVKAVLEMLELKNIEFKFDAVKELGHKDMNFDKFLSWINSALESKYLEERKLETKKKTANLRDCIDVAFDPEGELLCFKIRSSILRMILEKTKDDHIKILEQMIHMISELNLALYQPRRIIKT